MKRHIESSPEETLQPAIAQQQTRTRDRVFYGLGSALEMGMDTGEFLANSTVYATTRAIHATGTTARKAYRGIMGNSYHTAA